MLSVDCSTGPFLLIISKWLGQFCQNYDSEDQCKWMCLRYFWRFCKRTSWRPRSSSEITSKGLFEKWCQSNAIMACNFVVEKKQKLDRTYWEFSSSTAESIRPPVKSWLNRDMKAVGTFYFVTNAVMILNYSALLILY